MPPIFAGKVAVAVPLLPKAVSGPPLTLSRITEKVFGAEAGGT